MAVVLRTDHRGTRVEPEPSWEMPCKAVGKKPCWLDQGHGRGGGEEGGWILDVT